MRIAIVGAGVSGLVCAAKLQPRHDVHVFERNDWIGGHTHTFDVEVDQQSHAVDTGFIVYNERNYPLFSALLKSLDVATQPTRMTFGFASERTGLEYAGTSLSGLFAQRSNLFRPGHWRMLAEVLRFFSEARALLADPDPGLALGDFLDAHGFSAQFQHDHLLPMGAAIWSSPPTRMRAFPACSFARFFENHGLLSLRDRPEWRVIRGGSARYVEALTRPFRERIHLRTPVHGARRDPGGVELRLANGETHRFDGVVFACHSDEALALLDDASPAEKQLLAAIPYQRNEVVLHTDESILPRQPRARAAWNYRVPRHESDAATVTYDMNLLQGIDAPVSFLVTLNSAAAIDPSQVLQRFEYMHPLFDAPALEAQRQGEGLGRDRRTAYCGAYWGYGFHEDGVRSGLLAAEQMKRLAT